MLSFFMTIPFISVPSLSQKIWNFYLKTGQNLPREPTFPDKSPSKMSHAVQIVIYDVRL